MVSEKVQRFQGKNKDRTLLSSQIMQQLKTDGYKTQSASAILGIVIEAQKAGDPQGHSYLRRGVHDIDSEITKIVG